MMMFLNLKRGFRFRGVLVFTAITSTAVPVQADTLDWNVPSGSWTAAANWSPMQLPTASIDAKINNGGIAQLAGVAGTARDLEVTRFESETGNLQISAGGMLTTRDGYVGDMVTVAGAGSQWTARNILVGLDGSITVSAGAMASSMDAILGDQMNSQGVVTVTGANSKWTNTGILSMGFDGGSGELNVAAGGTAITTGLTDIGASAAGIGIVTVNAGSTWTAGEVNVGYAGSGNFDLNGGTAAAGSAYLGRGPGVTGTVNLNGASSMWTQSGSLYVGYDGTGHLNVGAGAKLITNGASGGVVGDGPNASGNVFLDPGSMWALAGDLQVGRGGFGEIMVNAGATLSNKFGLLGVVDGADGRVVVDGGTWTNMNTLVVGERGYGDLIIKGGGDVTASGTNPNHGSSIGNDIGNNTRGIVTVEGAGSTWTNNGIGLFIGNLGAGDLGISGGAQVSNGNGVVGRNFGSNGNVVVEDSGSTWTNNGSLDVGDIGVGVINVLNGGKVTNTDGRIGSSVNGDGFVFVEGAGSMWNNSGTLRVGASGVGDLEIGAGGTVTAIGGTTVGTRGTLSGIGTLVSTVTNNGVVAPGLSPGTLHVQGGFSQSSSGSLRIELASPTNYDVFDVTGSATLGGTLDIRLFDGYLPAPTDTFNFLQAGSHTGMFSNVTVSSSSGASGTFSLTSTPTGLALGNFQLTSSGNGLIAHWNAENGAADVTGNGHDGIFQGDAATTTAGPFGKAFTLDGSGDYISIGDELDMGTSDFTLSAWVKGDPTMDQWARIFDKGYASAYSLHKRASSNAIGFEMFVSGNGFGTTSELIDNTWHHVALVKSGTTVTIYADGDAEGSNTVFGGAQNNALPLLIGYNPGEGTQGFWKGLLDELKIFNRALTPAEIAALALIPANVPGDYNNNGTVDAADDVLWRNGGPLANEVDAPGTVNAADYAAWRARFGNTSGSGAAATAGWPSSAVPEPGAVLTAMAILCVVWSRRITRTFHD